MVYVCTSMASTSTGLYRLLARAATYTWAGNILGGNGRGTRYFVGKILRPRPGERLLDVGCGPGNLLEYLPDTVDYCGFDANPRYVAAARQKYGARGRFLCASVEEVTAGDLTGSFDLVVAKGVLHHLADGVAVKLVSLAHEVLRTGGTLVTWDGVRHPGQSRLARLLLAADRGRFVRFPAQYLELMAGSFASVESELHLNIMRVPYSHFSMRAQRV
jgi:SAM-dependent methyltransferase